MVSGMGFLENKGGLGNDLSDCCDLGSVVRVV